jgi:hypothetical protein
MTYRFGRFFWLLLVGVSIFSRFAYPTNKLTRSESLNGTWNLWFDEKADWQREKLVLNPHDLREVPVYPPTTGWDEMLKKGTSFRVPATWDEVYPRHHGVGWYWRTVQIPRSAMGKLIQLRFAAVRLRAEVYLNRQLMGYSLEGFTPFVVDITQAVHYGEDNLLAVRVTNPGGGNCWADFEPITWGDVQLPDSHDFGGIWQDVDLLVTPSAYIQDVFAAPLQDLETLRVTATIANAGSSARSATLEYEVYGPEGGNPVATGKAVGWVAARGRQSLESSLKIPHAELWSPESPRTYRLVTRLAANGDHDQVETSFGVRYFSEQNGRLFLNGHRVVVRSSINFGFYPYTVAYPTPELAEKEVRAAKSLGLNTLSCHRTACTPALLGAADRLGLMIYEEPGGAPRDRQPEPQSPAEAFERRAFLQKLSRLIVRDRNHPALVWWNLANEAFNDVVNDPAHLKPYINEMMRTAHRLDPSRFITYTSARQSIVMFRPFATEYGLIYDAHTVENVPAVWRDALTIEHSHFQAPVANEAFYNGESRNLDSLGDLPMLAARFAKAPDGSYEADWRHWAEMLEKSFAQYDLGKYFKTPSELCRLIGLEQGDGFSHEVESVRLSDAASGLAVNGWQSHPADWLTFGSGPDAFKMPAFWTSGMVDTLRNHNFPPEMLAKVNEPVHLAIVPIPSVAYTGAKVQLDVTLINERQVKGSGQLSVQILAPDGNVQKIAEMQVDIEGDTLKFVQPLYKGAVSPKGPSGSYRIEDELRLTQGQTVKGRGALLAQDASEWKLPAAGIELVDPTETLGKYFEAKPIFYPDQSSPSSPWQPVVMIYNPEGGNFSEGVWSVAALTESVSKEGRTALFWASDAAHGKTVCELLQKLRLLPQSSSVLPLGLHWFGGWEFDTPHPVFAGLPAPIVFSQEFAGAFAYWGITDFTGKLIAGLINAPPQVAVTLGELPFGKGKILVCSLNLVPYLDKDPVADRILAQLLNYAVNTAGVSEEQLRHHDAGKYDDVQGGVTR